MVLAGTLEPIFTALLPLFPQAFRYIPDKVLDAIWPDIEVILRGKGVKTAGRERQQVIGEAMEDDPVELASEIDCDPFKTLIRTILSARAKDEMTIKVSDALFEHYDTAEKLATAPEEHVKEIIKPIGFYNAKTKNIINTARAVLEQHGGKVPDKYDALIALPGVGDKVANCVLVYAFNIPAIPVDTHVHRIVNRWGLVETNQPEKTNKELMKLLPRTYWLVINDLLIRFGKEICKPITPRCPDCPLDSMCPKIILKKNDGKTSVKKKGTNGQRKKKK